MKMSPKKKGKKKRKGGKEIRIALQTPGRPSSGRCWIAKAIIMHADAIEYSCTSTVCIIESSMEDEEGERRGLSTATGGHIMP
jgi:hypothetical protein